MKKEQALDLKKGDKIRFQGGEAAFVRLTKSMRGALIDTGAPGHPRLITVLLSETEVI